MYAPTLTLLAVIGLTLVGCDAAQESAQALKEKAGETAKELAREAVSDTVNSLNESIDQAQESTQQWLGKPKEQGKQDKPEAEHQAPPAEGVET